MLCNFRRVAGAVEHGRGINQHGSGQSRAGGPLDIAPFAGRPEEHLGEQHPAEMRLGPARNSGPSADRVPDRGRASAAPVASEQRKTALARIVRPESEEL